MLLRPMAGWKLWSQTTEAEIRHYILVADLGNIELLIRDLVLHARCEVNEVNLIWDDSHPSFTSTTFLFQ